MDNNMDGSNLNGTQRINPHIVSTSPSSSTLSYVQYQQQQQQQPQPSIEQLPQTNRPSIMANNSQNPNSLRSNDFREILDTAIQAQSDRPAPRSSDVLGKLHFCQK